MVDRPINMPAPLVHEILLNTKTQTREPMNSTLVDTVAGDRLWVREHFFHDKTLNKKFFKADGGVFGGAHIWLRPSEMDRADSRLTLIVTKTCNMPLHDITPDECAAEGLILPLAEGASAGERRQWEHEARERYIALWRVMHDKIGPKWDDNPDVLAITFKHYNLNIDSMPMGIVGHG